MSAFAPSRLRVAAYWFTTVLIAAEMAMGGAWDLARIQYVRSIMDHLGYPHYVLFILGFWKTSGAVAILIPRFTRLKEWAYAGVFFNYSGATASHLFVGDGPRVWAAPAIFALIGIASWVLRPPSRVHSNSLSVPANPVTSAPAQSSSL